MPGRNFKWPYLFFPDLTPSQIKDPEGDPCPRSLNHKIPLT